jgi:hypothetical protein
LKLISLKRKSNKKIMKKNKIREKVVGSENGYKIV